jgi:hypothetical protein
MPPQARHTLVLELQVRENVGRTRAAMRDLAADTDRAARSVDDLGRRMDRAADRAERLAGGGRAVREMESREARRAGVYGFADERPTGGTAGAYGLLPAERVRGRPTALSTAERHAIDRRAADEQVRRRLEFQEPPGERLRPGQANQIIRDAALLRAGGAASEGGGLLGGLGRFAGPIAGLFTASALAKFAKVRSATDQDEGLYGDQRQRLRGQAIPGGSTFYEYADVFSGRARSLARLQEQQPVRIAETQGRLAFDQQRYALERDQTGLTARADAISRERPALYPTNIDRSTTAGERQFQLERRLADVKQRSARYDSEAATADAQRVKAQERLNKLVKDGADLETSRSAFQDRLDFTNRNAEQLGTAAERRRALYRGDFVGAATRTDEDPGVTRARLLGEIERRNAEIEGNAEAQRQAREDIRAASQRGVEARAGGERERLGGLRARADQAGERAATAESAALRIGLSERYDIDDQRRAFENLQRTFDRNPNDVLNLPSRERQLASQYAPERARDILTKVGEQSEAYKKLSVISPADAPPGGRKAARDEQTALENEARTKELQIDAAAAREAEKLGRDFATAMLPLLKIFADAAGKKAADDLARLKAGLGG